MRSRVEATRQLTGIKAVFFDFGDTLAHNNIGFKEALCLVLRSAGIPADREQVREAVIMADRELREEHRLSRDPEAYHTCRQHYYHRVLELLGTGGDREALSAHVHGIIGMYQGTWLNPEARYTLEILRRERYILGIVSNFSHMLPGILRDTGIYDLFHAVTYSDEVGVEKPESAIFRDALAKAGAEPCHAIHIGDSYDADVIGARGAGITPVWLIKKPPEHGDCLWIGNLMELLDLLGITHQYSPPTGRFL